MGAGHGSRACRGSKDIVPGLPAGTRYVQKAGGGGGYGDPRRRPAALVAREVGDGVIGVKAARDVYGVALLPGGFDVDEFETERLRAAAK